MLTLTLYTSNQTQLPTSQLCSTDIAASGMSKEIRVDRDGTSNHHSSNLGASSFQEQYHTSLEDREVDDSVQTSIHPLMDFMTQDVDLIPFGLLDENWWRLQDGNTNMGI